jgi:hypothetical protein
LVKAAEQGKDSLEDLKSVAESVNDNTLTEIRSLQSAFQDFKNDLDTSLGERRISIRFDRRTLELDNQLEDLLTKQEDIEADYAERIANARNASERSYYRNRLQDALQAVRSEQGRVEAERSKIEERSLKKQLEFAQRRAVELANAAQKAAGQGNLDEALGFKDASKRSLQDAQSLVEDLASLTDESSNRIEAALNDSEIGILISNLSQVSEAVTSKIPGINKTLQDTTAAAFEASNAKVQELTAELDKTRKQTSLLTAGFDNAGAAVQRLREAFDKTSGAIRLQETVAPSQGGAQAVNDFQNRLLPDEIEKLRQSVVDELRSGRSVQQDFAKQFARQNDQPVADDTNRGFDRATLEFNALVEKLISTQDVAARTNEADIVADEIRLLRQDQQRLFSDVSQQGPAGGLSAADIREQIAVIEALPAELRALNAPEEQNLRDQLSFLEQPIAPELTKVTQDLANALREFKDRTELAGAIPTSNDFGGEQDTPVSVELATILNTQHIQEQLDAAQTTVNATVDTPPESLNVLQQKVQTFFNENPITINFAPALPGDSPTAPTFGTIRRATGGVVTGPGTGTSDSIPALLSNGEFVIDAFTRQFYGSGFFTMLQKMAKSGRKLSVPAFATGGPVGSIPGELTPVVSATGAGGAPVHIHLPGGDTVKLREGDTGIADVTKLFRREASKRGRRV